MPKEAKKLSRRDRDKIRHRGEILDAAERAFVKSGGDHATIAEIAEEAEFAVGTLYKFFKNKEEIFFLAMVRIAEKFLMSVENEVMSEPDSLRAISKLILVRIQYVHEHGKFLQIFTDSKLLGNINRDEAIPHNCNDLYDLYLKKAAELFERAMKEGYISRLDPVYAALSLEGSINAFSAYWQRQGMSLSLEEQVETINRNCLDNLLTSKSGSCN